MIKRIIVVMMKGRITIERLIINNKCCGRIVFYIWIGRIHSIKQFETKKQIQTVLITLIKSGKNNLRIKYC